MADRELDDAVRDAFDARSHLVDGGDGFVRMSPTCWRAEASYVARRSIAE